MPYLYLSQGSIFQGCTLWRSEIIIQRQTECVSTQRSITVHLDPLLTNGVSRPLSGSQCYFRLPCNLLGKRIPVWRSLQEIATSLRQSFGDWVPNNWVVIIITWLVININNSILLIPKIKTWYTWGNLELSTLIRQLLMPVIVSLVQLNFP